MYEKLHPFCQPHVPEVPKPITLLLNDITHVAETCIFA